MKKERKKKERKKERREKEKKNSIIWYLDDDFEMYLHAYW